MPKTVKSRSTQMHASAGPLAGATVVITRPVGTGRSLKRNIQALGGTVLSLPGMTLHPMHAPGVGQVLAKARSVDVAIFVSPAAVRFAFALQPQMRFSRSTCVYTVGAATALALRRHEIEAIWPRERQDSEGLLALPQLARLRGKRVALIGAPGGRDVLPRTLRSRGAKIEKIDVYRRATARLDRRHFDALERASLPRLTMLSSADVLANLRAQLPVPMFARLLQGDAVVSSLRIAIRARAAGFERTHIAASAGSSDMLAATIGALAQHKL
jgi:uroporphyrinogen-III synthase